MPTARYTNNRRLERGTPAVPVELPNGAVQGPDVAWVRQERWDTLSPEQKHGFPPLCPDFVIDDDVLITPTGCEVLTAALPTHPEAIEALILG